MCASYNRLQFQWWLQMLQALKKYQTSRNIHKHLMCRLGWSFIAIMHHHASSGACPFSPSSSFLQALPGLPAPDSLPAVESLVPAGVPDWGKLRKAREDHPVICKGKKQKGDAKHLPEPKAGVSLTRPTLSKSHVLSCCNGCGKHLACVLCHIGQISRAYVV